MGAHRGAHRGSTSTPHCRVRLFIDISDLPISNCSTNDWLGTLLLDEQHILRFRLLRVEGRLGSKALSLAAGTPQTLESRAPTGLILDPPKLRCICICSILYTIYIHIYIYINYIYIHIYIYFHISSVDVRPVLSGQMRDLVNRLRAGRQRILFWIHNAKQRTDLILDTIIANHSIGSIVCIFMLI